MYHFFVSESVEFLTFAVIIEFKLIVKNLDLEIPL